MADTHDWRSDPLGNTDETVQWRPTIAASGPGQTWAGPTADGQWVVGTPGRHVWFTHTQKGVISLLPLLERPMSEVAADLQVTSLTQHSLPFERVVGAALDGSGYWAAFAITWLENGFPLAGHTDALRSVTADKKRVAQRPRQTAARLLATHDRRNHPTPERQVALSAEGEPSLAGEGADEAGAAQT